MSDLFISTQHNTVTTACIMQYQQHIEVLKCDVLSSFRKDPWEESIKSSSVFDLISSVVAINEPDRLADYARDLDLAFRTAFEAMIIAEETNVRTISNKYDLWHLYSQLCLWAS